MKHQFVIKNINDKEISQLQLDELIRFFKFHSILTYAMLDLAK